ncbi:MAG: triose-phosphate isomerase, partial [Planctomycetota bacterium]|nr:triose-phosphate isomerase [Planctomycetota bacterium]
MRVPFIAGNWKMYTNLQEASKLASSLVNSLKNPEQKEVVICPPYIYLGEIREIINNSGIKLGAQNAYFQPQGAFTGEVSFTMLKDIGCDYVIVGHSERRQIFNEDNELVNKKLKASLSCGLSPIFCVGELLEERE